MSSSPNATASGIFFGGTYLPWEAATSHFMIVGSTGSGKTLTLQMMMKSVLPALFTQEDQRAVIFDVKQDIVATLYGIFQEALSQGNLDATQINNFLNRSTLLLNPFDSRCHEWNIAEDVTSPETALQIATIFIPEEQSPNRYFTDAARDLLTGVIKVCIAKSKAWTLADILYAMRSIERIKHVLSQTTEGEDLISLHLESGSTSKSVVSTLRSKLAPYEVPAALWRHAGEANRKVSLKKFLKTNRVLVLGNNQAALAPIQAINRVIFQRLTELVLDETESETRRTWFFLDEVRKLERLEGLDDLMTNGRSKGAAVVLGFQSIEGMRAVYGKEGAGEIVEMPASIGILRVSGAATPQWASEAFGEEDVIQTVHGYSDSSNTTGERRTSSYSQNEQIRERRLYLSSDFRMLPRPQRGKSLFGYFWSAFTEKNGPYKAEVRSREITEKLPKKAAASNNFVPWPDGTSKSLPVWDEADYKRLNILPMPAVPPETSAQSNSDGREVFVDATQTQPNEDSAIPWTELGPP